MNQEMTDYCARLDLTTTVLERVELSLVAFDYLSDEPTLEIFLTDRLDSNSQREFVDMWGFTASYLLWSRDFLHDLNADVSPYLSSVTYVGIQYEELPFKGEASSAARITAEVQTAGRIYNELFATGANAGELRRLIDKFLLPNLRKGPSIGEQTQPLSG